MGHSLGSVIALKGLMYPEDAFARFMSFNRWYHPRFAYHNTIRVCADYPDKPHPPGWLRPDSALKTTNILELNWMLQSDKKFLEVAGDIGLSSLNNKQVFMRRIGAGFQWLLVLVAGLLIWPVSVGLLIRAVGFLPKQIADFLLNHLQNGVGQNRIDQIFNTVDAAISKLQPTLNPMEDVYKCLIILGIMIAGLSLGGLLHYWTDYIIAKIAYGERATGNRQIAVDYRDKQDK